MYKGFSNSGKSILFLGSPGVGKTTKLREIARLLADELGKRVIVVDTSNEIAGDGDIHIMQSENQEECRLLHLKNKKM